jgi:hypothetical protein
MKSRPSASHRRTDSTDGPAGCKSAPIKKPAWNARTTNHPRRLGRPSPSGQCAAWPLHDSGEAAGESGIAGCQGPGNRGQRMARQRRAAQPGLGRWAVRIGHSLTLRTSPGRRPFLGLSVSRRFESVATWFDGISSATAATASSCATAATQSDLLPSGAVTSTMGSFI